MQREFNRAANDSPRSGSSKQLTPLIWSAIVFAAIAVSIYLAMWSSL
jgi:hypothetical protein